MSTDSVLYTLYFIASLLVALLAREYVRAWMTIRLGVRASRLRGRLTLDPRRHAEPFGTLILPALTLLPILFGKVFFPVFAYARPQEVNRYALRKPDRDVVILALTGPVTNLLLAVLFGIGLRGTCGSTAQLDHLLNAAVDVNITMAVLHLIPLPPFDAALILRHYLKGRAGYVFESWQEFGVLFVLVIFFLLAGPVFGFLGTVGGGIRDAIVGHGCLESRLFS
jgi:Zn-dependent protease